MSDGEELSGVGRTSGARNELVAGLMNEAVASGECPFCSPYFEQKNGEWVVRMQESGGPEHWSVWNNPSPLSGTSHHIMMAPKRHVMSMAELTMDEVLEQQELLAELQYELGFASFTVFSRQGDPAFNSATVYHLHLHVVVSSGEPADASLIPARYLYLIEEVFVHMERFAAESGGDPLDYLDLFREHVDAYREAKRGKAIPIRAKFSNKIGSNRADESL